MQGFFSILLCAVGIAVLLPSTIYAAESDLLSGWAWSENIGWVSFNCTNTDSCGSVDYGVTIGTGGTPTARTMSGWAWSDGLGWIDFSNATYDELSGTLSGTAIVHQTTVSPYRSGDAEDDGWDGVINLESSGGVSYQPVLDDTDDTADGWDWDDGTYSMFEDYAWSDQIVGWLNFSCQNQNSCGTVGYGVFKEPFFFEFSATDGLASTTAVNYGGSFNHTWQLDPDTSIVSCTASGGPGNWSNTTSKATNPSPLFETVAAASSSATSTLTCTDGSGKSITRELYIWVQPPAPSISFTTSDSNIGFNTNTDLNWTALNVASCTGQAGDVTWNGSSLTIPTDNTNTENLTATSTDYIVACSSEDPFYYPGLYTADLRIYVERLVVDFYAEDESGNRITGDEIAFSKKSSVDLVWDIEYATGGCAASTTVVAASTTWDGVKPSTDGNHRQDNITIDDSGNFLFNLSCSGTNGQFESRDITVSIGKNPNFTEDLGTDLNQEN